MSDANGNSRTNQTMGAPSYKKKKKKKNLPYLAETVVDVDVG